MHVKMTRRPAAVVNQLPLLLAAHSSSRKESAEWMVEMKHEALITQAWDYDAHGATPYSCGKHLRCSRTA